MEVSNNSDTDPCAWVGVVDKLGKTVKVGDQKQIMCKQHALQTPKCRALPLPLTVDLGLILSSLNPHTSRLHRQCLTPAVNADKATDCCVLCRSNTPSMTHQTSGSRYAAVCLCQHAANHTVVTQLPLEHPSSSLFCLGHIPRTALASQTRAQDILQLLLLSV